MIGMHGVSVGDKITRWQCGRCDSRYWQSEAGLCANCGVDLRVIQPYPVVYVLTVRTPKCHWWHNDMYEWEKEA